MVAFNSFRRAFAIAAVLGGAAVAAPRPAAATETLDVHAYWYSVVDSGRSGQQFCGVRTALDDGGEFRLIVVNGHVDLVVADPSLNLTKGAATQMSITIDGHRYTGEANALDSHILVLEDVTNGFLGAFVDGDDMVATFGGVRWDIDLTGSEYATRDMIYCARHANPGFGI